MNSQPRAGDSLRGAATKESDPRLELRPSFSCVDPPRRLHQRRQYKSVVVDRIKHCPSHRFTGSHNRDSRLIRTVHSPRRYRSLPVLVGKASPSMSKWHICCGLAATSKSSSIRKGHQEARHRPPAVAEFELPVLQIAAAIALRY